MTGATTETPRRRVGLLGGTFDPVHIGHLSVAVEVRWALGLDVVVLMVANSPWQKEQPGGVHVVTPAADRLAIVEAAVAGVAGIEASALEIERGGPSYTADTLEELASLDPRCDIHLIVGADVASELDTWKRPDDVQRLARLVVATRPGSDAPIGRLRAEGWQVETVAVPALDVSSTDLRERIAAGRPVDFLIPAPAMHEVMARNLYARPEMRS